jgi:hypothetical protein
MSFQSVVFQNQVNLTIEQSYEQFQEKDQPVWTMIYPEQSIHVHLSNKQIEIILNGCRLNQRSAQKKLYRNYYSYAMSLALPYSSGYDNAVEIINQAFLKIYRDLKNVVPRYEDTVTSFSKSLKKAVINTGIDHIAKYNQKEMMANVGPRY